MSVENVNATRPKGRLARKSNAIKSCQDIKPDSMSSVFCLGSRDATGRERLNGEGEEGVTLIRLGWKITRGGTLKLSK